MSTAPARTLFAAPSRLGARAGSVSPHHSGPNAEWAPAARTPCRGLHPAATHGPRRRVRSPPSAPLGATPAATAARALALTALAVTHAPSAGAKPWAQAAHAPGA